MILTISEEIENIFNNITNFIEQNQANPFFWIILVLIIVAITYFAISSLSEK